MGLGVDGAASNEAGTLQLEVHASLMAARFAGGPTAMTVREALAHGTIHGARCLGRDADLGSLEVGKLADIALWRVDDLGGAGIVDPVAALVLGPPRGVEHLLVGGRLVVRGRRAAHRRPRDRDRRAAARQPAPGGVRLMAYELTHDAYGKAQNRLMRVVRDATAHVIRDVTVDVRLRGDFEAVYLEGDNTGIPATDTMKNTVFALGKTEFSTGSIEEFGKALVRHFVTTRAGGDRRRSTSSSIRGCGCARRRRARPRVPPRLLRRPHGVGLRRRDDDGFDGEEPASATSSCCAAPAPASRASSATRFTRCPRSTTASSRRW